MIALAPRSCDGEQRLRAYYGRLGGASQVTRSSSAGALQPGAEAQVGSCVPPVAARAPERAQLAPRLVPRAGRAVPREALAASLPCP